ncbi:MAG: hypothetical protein M3R27_08495 [Bacteroidota bacterium]|nr:hypothetical protein [Bacteroidota bacterium]
MKSSLLISALVLLNATSCDAQKKLDVNYQLRGYIYASSSLPDTEALGGYASSGNLPKLLHPDIEKIKNQLFLKIDTSIVTTFAKEFVGYKLFIGNTTDSVVMLSASDSRLSVIAEALVGNEWKEIEYLPSSWCGNSYHKVYLSPQQYWEFNVPQYHGKTKTKIRYRLAVGTGYIYSNEVYGSFNMKQLTEKQGHSQNGLMDPYNN